MKIWQAMIAGAFFGGAIATSIDHALWGITTVFALALFLVIYATEENKDA